jgi:hypothetical protein
LCTTGIAEPIVAAVVLVAADPTDLAPSPIEVIDRAVLPISIREIEVARHYALSSGIA